MPKLAGCGAVGLLLLLAPLRAQTPPATPAAALEFEVASVKEAPPIDAAAIAAGKLHVGMKIDGAHVDIGGYPLFMLICKAYDVKSYQLQAPAWMKGPNVARYDIVANMPHGATKDDVPRMLQALLRDRFKLEVHMETKDRNIYALIVGKDGPKLKESAAAALAAEGPGVSGSNQATIVQGKNGQATISDGEHTQKMSMSPDGKSMQLEIGNADMPLLAEGLTGMVDRPIVDMTGLKGKYDVTIQLSMDDLMAAARNAGMAVPNEGGAAGRPAEAASDPGSGRSLFKTMETLGLKLDARKAPLLYLIIDKAEKAPTEN